MRDFKSHYAALLGGSGPQLGQLYYEPAGDHRERSVPSHLPIVEQLAAESQSNYVLWASSNSALLSQWRVSHSNWQKYPPIRVTSPTVELLVTRTEVDTSQGPVPLELSFPSQYIAFKDFLPVAERLRADFLDYLSEPDRSVLVEERLQYAISLAVTHANISESTAAMKFLAQVAGSNEGRPSTITDDLALTPNLQQLRERRGQGLRTWFGTQDDVQSLSEFWEIRTLGAAELVVIGEDVEVNLDDCLPALRDVDNGRIDASVLFVIEAEEIKVASGSVDFFRKLSRIYVSKRLDFGERIDQVIRLAFPDEHEEWYESVSRQHFRSNQVELVETCKSSTDDVTRLEILLAGELHSIAEQLKLPAVLTSGSDSDVAQVLLTIFGTAVLKQVRSYSRNLSSLSAPRQWAGAASTVYFVTRLGFSALYAGIPSIDRPSYEESWGPSRIGDLHEFQEEIALKIQKTISEAGEALVDLPTGSGKTRIMIESAIRQHISEGRPLRILWIAERQELCEQAVISWRQLWRAKGGEGQLLRIHRLWGGNRIPDLQRSSTDESWVIVASRQKLRLIVQSGGTAQAELRKCTILIVDEAHHAVADSYLEIKDWRTGDPTPLFILGTLGHTFQI